MDECAGHMACMGGKKDACWLLVGKRKKKTHNGRCMHGWEENIKRIFKQ